MYAAVAEAELRGTPRQFSFDLQLQRQVDSKGNIYVAQWFGGKILKISPDGKLLRVFEIAAGDGTTNVAFGEREKELYVTVVKNPKDAQAKGSIVKIANVK